MAARSSAVGCPPCSKRAFTRARRVDVMRPPDAVDSPTCEPSPATAKSLTKADVLFMDGLHLEGSTRKQAQTNMPRPVAQPTDPAKSLDSGAKGSEIIQMGDMTITPAQYAYDITFPKSKGDPNPHLWMNPLYAQ